LTDVLGAVDGGLTETLWVPIAEAARQHDVSRAAMHKRVSKLIDAGRLSTKDGPRGTKLVNIVALNRVIATETDPAQALRNGSVPDAPDEPELPEQPEGDGDSGQGASSPASGGSRSYHAARASRETYQAESARLDLDERLGKLCYVDDVERRTMTAMRKVRDRFLALPAVIADRLAGAPDALAIRGILSAEIRAVLASAAKDMSGLDEDDETDAFADLASGERDPDQA